MCDSTRIKDDNQRKLRMNQERSVFETSPPYLCEKVSDIIDLLQEAVLEIPEKYRDSAKIRIEAFACDENDRWADITIFFECPAGEDSYAR